MATFNYQVDTLPMAASLNTVSSHVNATTAAVAAMETAVIIAEKESADNICTNIDKGFYCLIQSQISTKKAKNFSELRARFIQLAQMSKALTDKYVRMESDVARLKREYGKIFLSIDKSLEHRVADLDKAAYQLADLRGKFLMGRALKSIPEMLCSDRETENLEQTAFAARLKNKTSKALYRIAGNITESEYYKDQLDDLLSDERLNDAEGEYVPVVFLSEKSLGASAAVSTRVLPPEGTSETVKKKIEAAVFNDDGSLATNLPEGQEKMEVRKEFQKIVNRAGLDERVMESMMELFINGGH